MSRKTALCTAASAALLLWCAAGFSQIVVPGSAVQSSKHYRESGVGNATGRQGAANMTARALLGKDGNTTIELTTNPTQGFDPPGTPPGAFSKVQFKPLLANGNVLFTQNFTTNTASGYYKFTWPTLHRAEQVQLQGNLTGIDRNRTDVVTVVENVKMRPDITVNNLTFPPTATINQTVNIAANVTEMNGDAGATATAQLYIDGALVDHASNVYVDAGGSVSVMFSYKFTGTGTHSIQVTAANVTPADWDTSNNSASASISVVSPTNLPHYYASFGSETGGFPYQYQFSEQIASGSTLIENVSETQSTVGKVQGSSLGGWTSQCGNGSVQPIQWPINFSYSEAMDGTPAYSFTDTLTSPTQYAGTFSPIAICTDANGNVLYGTSFIEYQSYDNPGDHLAFVDTFTYYDTSNNGVFVQNLVSGDRVFGDVTYMSQGFQCYYWSSQSGNCANFGAPGDYYMWNSTTTQSYGVWENPGSIWSATVSAQDANAVTWSASASVPLRSDTYSEVLPYACTTSGPDSGGYTYTNCVGYNYSYVYVSGNVYQ